MKLTLEETLERVERVRKNLLNTEEEVKQFAEMKGIQIRTDLDYSYRNLLTREFPELNYFSANMYFGNGSKGIAEDITNTLNNKEYHILHNITVHEIKEAQCKIKTSKDSRYYFSKFKVFGKEIKPTTLKEYQNGSVWVKLQPDEMKLFMHVYNFTNTETEQIKQILNSLNRHDLERIACDVQKWQEAYVVNQIAHQYEISTRFLNYAVLKDLVKEQIKRGINTAA